MVSIASGYSATTAYFNTGATLSGTNAPKAAIASPDATAANTPGATSITLSEAAKASLATKDFATVIGETRDELDALLAEANRTSPLKDRALALDLSNLDDRQLYAMSSDPSFTPDEKTAAGLDMQRRLEQALSGPAAVAEVTGNFLGLYKAAAAYFDSLSPEYKSDPEWLAGRAALTDGLKAVQADPKSLPDAGASDPVALYLELRELQSTTTPRPIADVATSTRKTLDTLYDNAMAAGKAPTFNRATTVGTFIDLSNFESRSLSAIVLDTSGKFTPEETAAAKSALHAKSGTALLEGFKSAAKSSDPTAFAQNIISIYASMSPDERQAAGWSESFYQTAVSSYQSTAKLLDMFGEASGTGSWFTTLLGR